jgi:hypothetical protein
VVPHETIHQTTDDALPRYLSAEGRFIFVRAMLAKVDAKPLLSVHKIDV